MSLNPGALPQAVHIIIGAATSLLLISTTQAIPSGTHSWTAAVDIARELS
jgi:hypothetical protein